VTNSCLAAHHEKPEKVPSQSSAVSLVLYSSSFIAKQKELPRLVILQERFPSTQSSPLSSPSSADEERTPHKINSTTDPPSIRCPRSRAPNRCRQSRPFCRSPASPTTPGSPFPPSRPGQWKCPPHFFPQSPPCRPQGHHPYRRQASPQAAQQSLRSHRKGRHRTSSPIYGFVSSRFSRSPHNITPETPPSERPQLFLKKLHQCRVLFDFNDASAELKGKQVKAQTLHEMLEYITTQRGVITENVYPEVVGMVSIIIIFLIFPSFPPLTRISLSLPSISSVLYPLPSTQPATPLTQKKTNRS